MNVNTLKLLKHLILTEIKTNHGQLVFPLSGGFLCQVFLYQVDTAAKFVQDIIDKAKTEAAKKLNSEQIVRKQQKSLKLFIDFNY